MYRLTRLNEVQYADTEYRRDALIEKGFILDVVEEPKAVEEPEETVETEEAVEEPEAVETEEAVEEEVKPKRRYTRRKSE